MKYQGRILTMNNFLKKVLEFADKNYEKMPLDLINKKLKERDYNIDVRSAKIKYSFYCILILLFILLFSVMLGGCNSIPKQSQVDKIISSHHSGVFESSMVYVITECTNIKYENVKEIDKNRYSCKAIIHMRSNNKTTGKEKTYWFIQDLKIEYIGDIIQVDFGPRSTFQQ